MSGDASKPLTWQRVLAEVLSERHEYVKRSDILGIDIGYRIEDLAGRTKRIAVRFFVAKKRSEKELAASGIGMIPNPLRIEWEGRKFDVLTDVNEMTLLVPKDGRLLRRRDRTSRRNPLQPGISISHLDRGAGTLGAIVYGKHGEKLFAGALGSAHTMVPANPEMDDWEVHQPSPMDFGETEFDAIGSVPKNLEVDLFEHWLLGKEKDWDKRFGKNKWSRQQKEVREEILTTVVKMDAAYARLYPGRQVVLHQYETGATATFCRDAELGSVLIKSGRGSGVTRGFVDGIGYYRVNPTSGDLHWLMGFRLAPIDQRYPGTLSAPGDSGSMWYGQEPGGVAYGVGLHVDGEKTDDEVEYAVACHLPFVLGKLKVSLTPENFPDKDEDAYKHPIYKAESDWGPPKHADSQGIKEVKETAVEPRQEGATRKTPAKAKAATKSKAARPRNDATARDAKTAKGG